MLKNYFKIALRNIKRFPVYSLLNITGLAIGMTCTFLILLWVLDEISYDKFHKNANELYRVLENQYYGGGEIFPVVVTPNPLAPALKEEFPEIIRSSRFTDNYWLVQKGDEFINEKFAAVDQDFLEMFTVQFLAGDITNALKEPHSVVITEDMAKKYFDEENPIGKTMKINKNFIFTVTGVIKEYPNNSHLQFNLLVPFKYLKETGTDLDNWGNNSIYTYVELQKDVDHKILNEKITGFIKKYNEGSTTEIFIQNIKKVHLHSSGKFTADIDGHGDIANVRIFGIVAIFILLIACINFMNLSTAQSARRAKEIGMRKVSGANKGKVIVQFFGESILIAFVAHVIAMIFVELLLPGFNNLSGKQLDVNYNSYKLYLGLISIIIFTGLLAGSYPALFLSSFKPLNVIKGVISRNPGNSSLRRILVILQFSLSIFLIICTLIISSQLNYIQNRKLGLNKENISYFRFGEDIRQKRTTVKDELVKNPNIISASVSNQIPTSILNSSDGLSWEGKSPDEDILFHMVSVDEDYANTFKLELHEGRFFSKDFPSDSLSVVINEKALDIMGIEDPIGKTLSLWRYNLKLIGVVKNFHFKSIRTKIEPLIMFMNQDSYNIYFMRMNPDNIISTVEYIEKIFKKFDPASPFHINFLDKDYDNLYRSEKQMSKIFNYFSLLAIFISCLGLIGLSSFMVERRTKEIGIRKTNGARTIEIFTLLSKEFVLWVLISFLIAAPVAWYVMDKWLQGFAYHTNLNWWIFILAGLLCLIIAILTISWQSYWAARKNPVEALRYE
ncbi:MAG: ABC transporter permease [Bacteroidales bacterium]|nr:ABC transporter permease [Bacteroidales bacterium]